MIRAGNLPGNFDTESGHLSTELRRLLEISGGAVARAVLVPPERTAASQRDQALLVLVGPQRWHSSHRGRLVDLTHALGGRLGIDIDVYPVRPSDLADTAAHRNAVVIGWLDAGTRIHVGSRR